MMSFSQLPGVKKTLQGVKVYSRKSFEFKIWKEPLLVQKQAIPQKKSSGIQLFAAGKFEGVALSGGHYAPLP